MTRSLGILGAGGHGKVIADTAIASGWRKIAFYDDAWPKKQTNGRWQVSGRSGELLEEIGAMDSVTVGIGRNNVRLQKLSELLESGATLATIVHPHASVSRFAEMGAGSVVFASAVVNVDCVLGMGCIVNTGATVDRDCRLAACVHVCPGVHLASDVTVGEGSFIGIGAVVKEGVTIGANVVVGAGAVVLHDVPDGVTIMGVPAR
ncbi:hexapeptide transferase family protein [Alloalcanivorax xenomutans]|uniref:acetyltransferase n=1 Tax=Alloalcanivorax xenomutans TaxID=1094342 RepID=UPI0006D5B9DA|nr:acetyltransferase [Alloalcanivorax xenomutans]CUR48430.1 hexapeptide transferase family protein [Alloalcanivorax xenomutans]